MSDPTAGRTGEKGEADPSAGPSSPSPAEQIAREWLEAEDVPFDVGRWHSLSSLVRSVEERTLREAAINVCVACAGGGSWEPVPERLMGWQHRHRERPSGRKLCDAAPIWSRLASLMETRER